VVTSDNSKPFNSCNKDKKIMRLVFYFALFLVAITFLSLHNADAATITAVPKIDNFDQNDTNKVVESKNDPDILFQRGVDLIKLGNYEEALPYFDRILEINASHVGALSNKGSILAQLGNPYEALLYYDKVLKIEPDNKIISRNVFLAQNQLKYNYVEGSVEVQFRDSEGHLVGFMKKSGGLKVLNHISTPRILDQWPLKEVITRGDKTFEVRQLSFTQSIDDDRVWGMARVVTSENIQAPLVYHYTWGLPIEKGDKVTMVFTMFRPLS